MEYTTLGRTGLQVSRLCLGTMTFGRETDEATSHTMLNAFVEAGGTFIDTADAYTSGASEAIIGNWLVNRNRYDLVIATKVRFGSGLNRRGLGRKHILDAVEGSLRRLKTDYIDLYQVHMWDASTPLDETFSTLDGLVRSGRVRYIGISNYSGWQLQKAIDLCRAMHWEPVVSLQPLYNLLDREAEWELLPICRNEGVGVIPWSPLRGGWLTGKYRRGMEPPQQDTRIKPEAQADLLWSEAWANYANDFTWHVVDTLLKIAEEAGKTPAQVALNWLLQQDGITAPIIGARTPEQLLDNLGAVGWSLSTPHLAGLTDASHKRLPYPYELLRDLVNV